MRELGAQQIFMATRLLFLIPCICWKCKIEPEKHDSRWRLNVQVNAL